MEITINGEVESLEQEESLAQFLKNKGLDLDKLVVEYNGKVISDVQDWEEIILSNNDTLEVLKFVGGG